ncbi:peptidase inhibitor family I36 protein [Streptomyces natalensis]|uniref:peptidase inhibitor family I36 protein n=1 Tax=Streptomyces natalensis TaxID=68242 RepID=UPI0005C95288|nr:peptidase inhibitor family I36 protein [Streptomyces natalensis]
MRIRLIAAAGAAAAALSLGAALPAFANSHASVAAPLAKGAKVKVFQDAKYKNRNTTFTENMWNLKHDGWNDTISSAINEGKRAVTFSSEPYFHGAHFSLAPGYRLPATGYRDAYVVGVGSLTFH